jgi:hypothetical protein
MNNLTLVEDYSFEQNMLDLLNITEMDYNKSLHTKVPVCIAAAVYRVSAGNSMPCKYIKIYQVGFIGINPVFN